MWISILIYGSAISIAIWVLQRRGLNKTIRYSTCFLICSVLIFSLFLDTSVFLGDDSWYNQTPAIEIIYLSLMWLGMSASYLTRKIEERREKMFKLKAEMKNHQKLDKVPLEFDLLEFLYPFIFSVFTFSFLLKQIEIQQLTTSNIALSFQSGFFWQTLIKKEVKV